MDLEYWETKITFDTVSIPQRLISGYAAYHSNRDRVGDIIDPQASVKALARLTDPSKEVGVFLAHQVGLPVGIPLKMEARPQGLWTETYVLKGPVGDNLLAVAKDLHDHGQSLGQSIGYKTVDSRHEQTARGRARRLLDYAIKEYSFAAHQAIANPLALTESVKSKSRKANNPRAAPAQQEVKMQYRVEQDIHAGTWTVYGDVDADGDEDDNMPMGTYQSEEMANAVALALRTRDTMGEDPDDDMPVDDGKTLPVVEGEVKAVWSTAHVNDLNDSAFLFIEDGGVKDDEGKTTPRSKRHLPFKDAEGKIDATHLRNALARLPQTEAPGLDDAKKAQLRARARRMLESVDGGKTYQETDEWKTGGAPLSVRGLAYRLLDISEQMADELKAMRLLGEETKDNLRIRPAVRDQLAAVAMDITKAVEWATMIDTGHDEKAYIARVQAEFDLLAL